MVKKCLIKNRKLTNIELQKKYWLTVGQLLLHNAISLTSGPWHLNFLLVE